MGQLSDLLDRVHDEFPGVPELLALRSLSDAAKEFCTRTHAWQEDLSEIAVVAGTGTYDVDVDTGLQLVALKEVRLDGRRLDPMAAEVPRRRRTAPVTGATIGYIQVAPTSIQLVDTPAEDAVLTAKAALTLARNNTVVAVPDSLLDEYGEAIAAGAKMRLVRMAAQPWYAPDMSVGYATVFYSGVNTAKMRTMTSLGVANVQIEMRGM